MTKQIRSLSRGVGKKFVQVHAHFEGRNHSWRKYRLSLNSGAAGKVLRGTQTHLNVPRGRARGDFITICPLPGTFTIRALEGAC